MRDHILSEIRRIAAECGGRPPGQNLFEKKTGVSSHQWRGKHWARWGDALVEAGFAPNRWTTRLDSETVLSGIIGAMRHHGRVPTKDELLLYRAIEPSIPSDQAIRRHFGGRSGLIAALEKRAAGTPDYADIAEMLAVTSRESTRGRASPNGLVHLFRSGDVYTIVQGKDLERHVKAAGGAFPRKMEVVHSILTDDPPGIEAYWRHRFADKHADGDWFRLDSSDVMAFKRRTYQ